MSERGDGTRAPHTRAAGVGAARARAFAKSGSATTRRDSTRRYDDTMMAEYTILPSLAHVGEVGQRDAPVMAAVDDDDVAHRARGVA